MKQEIGNVLESVAMQHLQYEGVNLFSTMFLIQQSVNVSVNVIHIVFKYNNITDN